MAHHLLSVAREYKISSKLAFFMADNASNDDSAIQILRNDLDIHHIAECCLLPDRNAPSHFRVDILSILDTKLIPIPPIQIHNLTVQPSLVNRFLEILQRAEKDIIVVVMDGDRDIRLDKLQQLQALLRIHRHHQQRYVRRRDRRPAEMDQHQIDVLTLVPLRDLLQLVDHERVPGDVDAVAVCEV